MWALGLIFKSVHSTFLFVKVKSVHMKCTGTMEPVWVVTANIQMRTSPSVVNNVRQMQDVKHLLLELESAYCFKLPQQLPPSPVHPNLFWTSRSVISQMVRYFFGLEFPSCSEYCLLYIINFIPLQDANFCCIFVSTYRA